MDNLDPSFTLDRMQLRLKDGGAGFRLPSTTVDHAFLNTMVMIGPILVGGPHQHQSGIAPGLAEALGADSFADSNRATHQHATPVCRRYTIRGPVCRRRTSAVMSLLYR
jgi:hypothetical protein